MADDYIGRKMEEYRMRPAVARHSLRSGAGLGGLLLKNRSHRAYDAGFIVRADQLRTIIAVNTRTASACNRQALRFRPVLADEAAAVVPHIRLGGALPGLSLPPAGQAPNAFIVVCATVKEDRYLDIDLGISVQSMLLRAVEIGLNGICIASFDREAVRQALGLELEPLLVVAIGRGAERIRLVEIPAEADHDYYRTPDGTHCVPKVRLDDLLL